MVDPFEISPEATSKAKELVEMARENTPEKLRDLKQQLSSVEDDTLEQFAKEIEAQKISLNNEIINGLRERTLKLSNLETRVKILRQFGIEQKAEAPKTFVESVKSGISGIPGLFGKGFDLLKTGFGKGIDFAKNIRGRDLKRGALIGISFIEKAPGVLVSLISGNSFIGSFANLLPSFNFANRKLAEMDIEDAIAKQKQGSETITFTGITRDEFTAFEAAQKQKSAKGEKTLSFDAMVQKYLELQRKNSPGAPISVTLSGIQFTDELKSKVAAKETSTRQEQIAQTLGVSDVRFDSTKTSVENGIVYASEKDLDGTTVKKGSALESLLSAKNQLPSATNVILTDKGGVELSWETDAKTARVSKATDIDLTSVEKILAKPKPTKFNTMVIKNGGRALDTISYTLSDDKDVLTVPNNPLILAALQDKLEAIPFTGIDAAKGATWKLQNGEFVLQSPIELKS